MCSCAVRTRKCVKVFAGACLFVARFFQCAEIFFSNNKNNRKGNFQPPCHKQRKTKGSYRAGLLVSGLTLLFSVITHAQSDEVYSINIPAQSVSASLTQLSEQTEQMLLFSYEIADTLQAKPTVGRYTVMQALDIMLAGTGYTGGLTQQGVLMISIKKSKASDDETKGKSEMINKTRQTTKKQILAGIISALTVGGVVAQDQSDGGEADWLLEEVVVTAQKRGEGAVLQDVPAAISVLTAETIKNRNLLGMEDYLPTVPGVSFINNGVDFSQVIIRGLNSLSGQSTAAVYLGDMPMSNVAVGAHDVKLVDIERVEILKGPQGTLYGSSALGGVVRSIPHAPNMNALEGYVNVDVAAQSESDDYSQSVIGVLSMPLINDQLALRVAGYRYDNAGYVDVISTEEQDDIAAENGATPLVENDYGGGIYQGVRASIHWLSTDDLSVSMILGRQELDGEGSNRSSPELDGYQNSFMDIGRRETAETKYGSLTIDYDLSWGSVTSITSLTNMSTSRQENLFPRFPGHFLQFSNLSLDTDADSFAQEFRFASRLNGPLQFLAGVFYEDVERDVIDELSWIGSELSNPFFPQRTLRSFKDSIDYQQKALFGEVSYQIDDQWQLTLGGRHFDYDRVDTKESHKSAAISTSGSSLDIGEAGDVFKANLSFTPNENALIYAGWSEGFRLGRGQDTPSSFFECDVDNDGKLDFTDAVITNRVEADTTENWELGAKFVLLDRRLTFNTALFRINWENLPARIEGTTPSCRTAIFNNIGEARSQGVELEVNYKVSSNLSVNLATSYVDTKVLEAIASFDKGGRLTLVPRVNANLGMDYQISWGSYPAFLRVDISHVGSYVWEGNGQGLIGDYLDLGIRAGMEIGDWSLALYGTNLTNDDKFIARTANSGVRMKPRTVGLSLNYTFW